MLSFLEQLNPEQRLAAETTEGPLLILAGAGTGKTRAITFRMANLISKGVPAENILAVTFTNKAAEEMQTRVTDLLLRAGIPPERPWLSTFHSLCARLLRREASAAGLPRNFAIFDDDDQLAAVKLAMQRLNISDETLTPRNVLSKISHAKNHGQSAAQIRGEAFSPDGRKVADVFEAYEKLLAQSNALDFDDLLLRSARLLKEAPQVRERWQQRFQYIHVDEYQDTNRVQYDLLRLLTSPKQNICVVGDEDQSIYRWRGADVSILLSFSRDFPAARVIRLERNYRSTQNILDAAGSVVKNNTDRLGKTLKAESPGGRNLRYFEARDAQSEAEFVAGELQKLLDDDSDQTCAVEYRTNFQSRAFEEVFRRRGIRYKLVGGFSFYNRAEVKDALAYVRLAMHPEDDISLLRVLNVPPRGIGKTTLDTLRDSARANSTTLWATIELFLAGGSAGRATAPVRAFYELILRLQQALNEREPAEFLRYVLDETGYMAMLKDRNAPEDVPRIENLEELTRAVAESMDAGESFTDFLDAAALVSDADSFEGKPGVTLITLHSTKGLEFDHVFLTGMEEGICPHGRSINEEKGVEEERRLVYVGMTRARKTLTLTRAVYRRIFGNEQQLRASQPSRFLAEIPSELVDTAGGSMAEIGQTRRYEPDPEYSYSPDEFMRRVRGGPAASQRSATPRQRSETSSFGRSSSRRTPADPMLGRKVRHPEYGVGTVVGVEGDEDDRRVSVSFPGRGTKKFIERYAQLQPA
ncbi:MAG: UvrD-helicase domain-containing protein [Acidobacteria bacterium]|nr:UvrD-helicase domain-containing protein [Acidobacteriota bacterium]MBS1867076.1 UvrD-helicase domain-containing protein [Acidobacteriota bacterium]